LLLLLKQKGLLRNSDMAAVQGGLPAKPARIGLLRSSGLMNLFETTFFGAYWGNLYERSPQFRFGLVHKLGGSRNFKLSPEVAIMMPSEGNLPAGAVTSVCTTTTTPTTATGFTTTSTNSLVNGLGN
jgi:hypothetical protein